MKIQSEIIRNFLKDLPSNCENPLDDIIIRCNSLNTPPSLSAYCLGIRGKAISYQLRLATMTAVVRTDANKFVVFIAVLCLLLSRSDSTS